MFRNAVFSMFLGLAAGVAGAQDPYPSRPVKVIVPWPAGGSNDVAARIVMKAVTESTGQPFVIDNRGGAGGTIGADAVAKATPDGYTIMVHSGSHIANAYTYPTLPYNTLKDFAPVSTLVAQTMGLAVPSGSKARTFRELMAMAKAAPGKLTVSTNGLGSQLHLQLALLQQTAGFDVLHVPYRGGSPQVTALMGGETDAGLVSLSSIISPVQAQKARLLVTFSKARSEAFPNVPTLEEEGVKGLDFVAWVGAFAPVGTPEAIVSKLNAEIAKALQRDDVKKALAGQALEPFPLSPRDFSRRIESDYAKYGKIFSATSTQMKEK